MTLDGGVNRTRVISFCIILLNYEAKANGRQEMYFQASSPVILRNKAT